MRSLFLGSLLGLLFLGGVALAEAPISSRPPLLDCIVDFASFVVTSGGIDVQTQRPNEKPTSYRRTDRPVTGPDGQTDWPAEWRDLDALRGHRVLDVGCGNGATVREMRDRKIEAFGIDIKLSATQKQDAERDWFRESDAAATGFPDRHFRRVYSSYSVFLYESDKPAVMERSLRELARVTEEGGRLCLAGADLDAVRAAAGVVGGLRVVAVHAEHSGAVPGHPESRRSFATGEIELEVLPARR